jgi:hypothetical protein
MARIDDLAERYAQHIRTPWQRTVSGAQRVIIVTYDKEDERLLRARRTAFETATSAAGHPWHELDLTGAFAAWLAADEYREAYFDSPDSLRLKIESAFTDHVADLVRVRLTASDVADDAVISLFGVGALFGFTRLSEVLKRIERDIRGRLLVFFPGQLDGSNYRLLDARDGWNYLAVPITLHDVGSAP